MPSIEELKQKLPQTIELNEDAVVMLDQRKIPDQLIKEELTTVDEVAAAIKDMHIRGAQAIGAAAMAGMYLAAKAGKDLESTAGKLKATRPTAVNLSWGVDKMLETGSRVLESEDLAGVLFSEAQKIIKSEVQNNIKLGEHGRDLIKDGMRLQTHCNAGSLSSIWYGTATAPMFAAWCEGKKISVYADETRPRLQGARLTAWELKQVGIDYTIVTDNACGALLANGKVDAVIVGADRIAANGDTANKIGTYPLALMAHEHGVPFYVAAVEATIDFETDSGKEIPIEERSKKEFWDYLDPTFVDESMPALNIAFDVTPAKYVTKIITEKGIKDPSELN
ncbi:S-methyl-5-thioribose-1-phosphate isomerase [Patescibacteria group bacterium]